MVKAPPLPPGTSELECEGEKRVPPGVGSPHGMPGRLRAGAAAEVPATVSRTGADVSAGSDRRPPGEGRSESPAENSATGGEREHPSASPEGETTEVESPSQLPTGELRFVGGPEPAIGRRFPIRPGRLTIGRGASCDIRFSHDAVSRLHVEIVVRDDVVEILHHSKKNSTRVNGKPVLDRCVLCDGDDVILSEFVRFEVDLFAAKRQQTAGRDRSLFEVMQSRLEIEREVDRFRRTGAFLDIDVVDSFGLKNSALGPEELVVSFERFRTFLVRTVSGHGGAVLNSNGDELMVFFDSVPNAVVAGIAILERLVRFNEEQNLLQPDFRVRVGIHCGESAVDLERGYAYSAVVDLTGHLQKAALPNTLLLSDEVVRLLPEEIRVSDAGVLPRHGVRVSRWPA